MTALAPAVDETAAAFVRIVQSARDIDLLKCEGMESERLLSEPVPEAQNLTRSSIHLLDRLVRVIDPATTPKPQAVKMVSSHTEELQRELSALIPRNGQPQLTEVADMAYMGGLELHQQLAALERLTPQRNRWDILGTLGSGLGHVIKVGSVVESSLADLANRPRHLDNRPELETSLRVRAAYVKFRAGLLLGSEELDTGLELRLRRAASSIAQLIGRHVYPQLRIADRVQLRRLQERVLDWLRGTESSDTPSGERLWRDLNGFADLIMSVNHRHDLVTHDRQLLLLAISELVPNGDLLVPETLSQLRLLVGRNRDLDLLLEDAQPRSSPQLLRQMRIALVELGKGSDTVS